MGQTKLSMIELNHISLKKGDKQLFHQLSLNIPSGERLLVRGASGSGKTSLLRLILGFERPDSGRISIGGVPMSLETVWLLRRRMAYVSQEMELGMGRVADLFREVFSFRANRGLNYDSKEAISLLEIFDLKASSLDDKLETLSGGEKQRIAIILSLLLRREIYLLDEVTSALDQSLKERIAAYFEDLSDSTLVVVSHDRVWNEDHFITLDL